MDLIVLAGPRGSGKDAIYKILKDEKRVNGKLSFAGPLKDICSEIFGLHINLLNDPILKEKELKEPIVLYRRLLTRVKWKMQDYVEPEGENFYNIHKGTIQNLENKTVTTPRQLLQLIGTELIRQIYPEWHIKAFLSEKFLRSKQIVKSGTYTVTDCRFVNEYTIPKNNFKGNITFAYVERPEAELNLKNATHSSELEVKEVKQLVEGDGGLILSNDGTLEDLKKLVLGSLGGKDVKSGKKGTRVRRNGDKVQNK